MLYDVDGNVMFNSMDINWKTEGTSEYINKGANFQCKLVYDIDGNVAGVICKQIYDYMN